MSMNDYHRVGRKDGGIQRRLEVRRPEDLTQLFAACLLARILCWLHALPVTLMSP
jgi:hypothetical protein